MKALCWHGKHDIRYDTVPDPTIEDARDAIVKVSSCAICGSDLHLFDGFMPGMQHGDIMGHEFMGEVVEVGSGIKAANGHAKLKVGDRVVVPFTIICGECDQCRRGNFSVCERSNRNRKLADTMFGHGTAGLFGYSHLTGGYPGGQAEYVRVPFADAGCVKIDSDLTDDQVLFLGDILPTGWQAAVQCDIEPDDTVAIWGAGPVASSRSVARCCLVRSSDRDRPPARAAVDGRRRRRDHHQLRGRERARAPQRTHRRQGAGEVHRRGRHGGARRRSIDSVYDRAKQAVWAESDRPHVLREMIYACRPAGTISVPGVYGGLSDKFPFGLVMNKGLTIRAAQTHVNRWTDDLLRRIESGQIDPSFVITHKVPLSEGPQMYTTFRDKHDGCIKVVLTPGA